MYVQCVRMSQICQVGRESRIGFLSKSDVDRPSHNSRLCRLEEVCVVPALPADLRHAAANIEVALGDAVPPRLAPDRGTDPAGEVGVTVSAADNVAQVDFVGAQQAKPELAISPESNP